MKICVLRRDGGNVHNGMASVIPITVEQFFGETKVFLQKNETEFTQVLAFDVPNNMEHNVVPFIQDVAKLNPLYAVRIITD